MKMKFLLMVLPMAVPLNAYALGTVKVCCDTMAIEGQPCKCYSDNNGSCAACNGGGITLCTDCDDTDWAYASAGYESRIRAMCMLATGTCNKSTEYRCAKGYYGTANLAGTSGCTRCPASGGVYGTTDAAGASAITECYIPSNSSMSDGSGKYIFTSKCYYTN